MDATYSICLLNALSNLAISLGYLSHHFNSTILSSSLIILGRIKPDDLDLDMACLAVKPKPKSPSGAASATVIPELDEIQFVRQLLEALFESYRDSNITELEKKNPLADVLYISLEGLKKEEPSLKARLLRATVNHNSFYLTRYLSYESNYFVTLSLDEFEKMIRKVPD